MRVTSTYRMAAVVAACVALGACKSNDNEAATDSAAGVADTTAMAGMAHDSTAGHANTGPLSDPQIFGALGSSDTGEIALGKLGQTKATHAQVKAFARKLVTEHQAMMKETSALASRLTVTPAATTDSSIIDDLSDDVEDLQKKDAGKDWDDDFLDKLEDSHQKTLDFLDRAANNATHADLKAMLTKARPKVEAHLNEIKQLKERKTD